MADYYLRKWTPSSGQSRDISPDVLVWDDVIKKISASSQGRDTVGLLLGSSRSPSGNEPQVVMIEDIVPPRPLSNQNGEFSQTILSELLDDWRNNYRGTQLVGWFRTISTPSRQLRLPEGDSAVHRSYFTQPYQVALAFSQSSADLSVGFFKADRGNLDVERIYPFMELSDAPSAGGLPIRNMNVADAPQQASASGSGGRRQTSQSSQSPLPSILRLGLPILILLAVLTPLLLYFDVIGTGSTPAVSEKIIELTIPAANDQGMSQIRSSKLGGPAEGISSITFRSQPGNENAEDGTLWIKRLAANPLESDPPGGFIAYAYYSIASKDTADKTDITFAFDVPEHWKELRDVGIHTIRAYKNSGDGWEELTNIGEVSLEQGNYEFEANTTGLSYFALGGTRANQPVSVTVEIPDSALKFVNRISLAKGGVSCNGLRIDEGNPFDCDLGTELSLSVSFVGVNPGITGWSVAGRKYSIDDLIRITSDTSITAVVAGQVARQPTLGSTPPPNTPEALTTATPEPTEPPPTATPEPTEPPPTATLVPTEPPPTATLVPTLVKVKYQVDAPDSGEVKAYLSSSEELECEVDPVPTEDFLGFLCPAGSDIVLRGLPNEGFKFQKMEIQLANADPETYDSNSVSYRLEADFTEIEVRVFFIAE